MKRGWYDRAEELDAARDAVAVRALPDHAVPYSVQLAHERRVMAEHQRAQDAVMVEARPIVAPDPAPKSWTEYAAGNPRCLTPAQAAAGLTPDQAALVACPHHDLSVIIAGGSTLDDHDTSYAQCRTCQQYLVVTTFFSSDRVDTRPMTEAELVRCAASENGRDRAEWLGDFQGGVE